MSTVGQINERSQAKPVAAVINLFRLLESHPELRSELRV